MSKSLVLSSAFLQDYAYLGGLLSIEEDLNLNDFDEYVCVSTSSIYALLLSLGFTGWDISQFVYKNDFFTNIATLENRIDQDDEIRALKIKAALDELIKEKMGIIPTLCQLYYLTGKKIQFLVQKNDGIRLINEETYPNLICTEAIMICIHIPTIFQLPRMVTIYDDLYDCSLKCPCPIQYTTCEEIVCYYLKFSIHSFDIYSVTKSVLNDKVQKEKKNYENTFYIYTLTEADPEEKSFQGIHEGYRNIHYHSGK